MLALQRLYAAQLVGAERPFALGGQYQCLAIQGVDIFNLRFELGIRLGCEPVPDQVWLEIPLFSSRAA